MLVIKLKMIKRKTLFDLCKIKKKSASSGGFQLIDSG